MIARIRRMSGRDPQESHRAATPLELLFDLAFVVAFGQAADQLSHFVADANPLPGIVGFTFAIVCICWAWINFSWFASAYDTDDWFYRLCTMVQMIGVVVFSLGIPAFFDSLAAGGPVDNAVPVLGYVTMRVALIGQWLRAARGDPARRRTAMGYVYFVGGAQLGWIVTGMIGFGQAAFFTIAVLLFAVELVAPILAERKTSGTPWNAYHIAERYGLLAIIALGEGVFGTVAVVSVVVQEQGWSTEAVLIIVAGIGLTFGLWWTYFMIPSGQVLSVHRERSTAWSYGHIPLYGSIAAIGAGLHIAALVVEGDAHIDTLGAIVAVVVPALIFTLVFYGLYTQLLRTFDLFHIGLFAGTVAMLAIAVALAANGASMGACLIVVTLAPAVPVVGWELLGNRHQAEALQRMT
ncbi:MAG: low temperature requirement protein A [Rhodoglobus sp.]